MPLMVIDRVSKRFDGVVALDGFSMVLDQGEAVAVVGPNGSGKSTLFDVITGFVRADCGRVAIDGINVAKQPPYVIARRGVTRLFQNVRIAGSMTVADNVICAFPGQFGEHLIDLLVRPRALRRQESKGRDRALAVLGELGVGDLASVRASELSYGQQKLVAIACCLATGARILLLDEPCAGLSPALADICVAAIQKAVKEGRGIVVVEHDMDVLARVCQRMVFIDSGVTVCEGPPEVVRNNTEVLRRYLLPNAAGGVL